VAELDLADIQGNILNGYTYPAACHLFFHVCSADRGRDFLHRLVDEVTIQSSTPWPTKPANVTNVALTYAGLEKLGVTDAVLRRLPGAFREPIEQRAADVLGDTGDNRPGLWDPGMRKSHVLVLVFGDDETVRAGVERVSEAASRCGLEPPHCQPARSLDNQREHFGFADGFGQPAVEGAPMPTTGARRRRPGQGVPQEDGITWRDLKAGEFILGYPDEDGVGVLEGPEAPLLRNGSYLVYRKLRQEVGRFEALLNGHADRFGATLPPGTPRDRAYLRELLAAKLTGRWRDGVALELAERRSPADVEHLRTKARRDLDNDFRYAQTDAEGRVCPRGAHVRRTNPRDDLPGGGALSRRHRIIRRGMPYGAEWTDGAHDDERGLIFMCFNADFERQFEFIQRRWVNDGNAFGLGDDRDFFAGTDQELPKMVIQGDRPYLLAREQVVFTRGCEYLLMPSISALRDIVSLRPGLVAR
jgi:Dyp-type peroxidase family